MTTIITRHSEVANARPLGGTVAPGELCVNTADGFLFTSSDGSNIVPVGGSSGGGGGSDLPNGSADGQMLRWNATGEPTWSVTDIIKATINNNVAIGGPEFSAGYKLTVNGATYVGGTMNVSGKVTMTSGMDCTQTATFGQLNASTGITTTGTASMTCQGGYINLYTDPQNNNHAIRRGWANATYVTLNATQTIGGEKTFSQASTFEQGLQVTGGFAGGVAFTSLATGSNMYLRLGTTGFVFVTASLDAADVEVAPGENLLDVINALKAQIVALGGTI